MLISIARLGPAALILLTLQSARADVEPGGHPSVADPATGCRDEADDLVTGIRRRITAAMEITGAYSPPYHVGGWDEDGETYTLSTGLVVLESCFEGMNEAEKRERAALFTRAHGDFLRGLQTCAHWRHLPANPASIYALLEDSPPEISCDEDECGDRAGACWQSFPQNVNIKVIPKHISGSTLMHELLHATGNCDNQSTSDHNVHSDASDSIDEVTFWEDYCMSPGTLLKELREGRDRCEVVLNHDDRDQGEPYTAADRATVCGYLREYGRTEDRYLIDLTSDVLPAALTCDSGIAGCGDAEQMNERLHEYLGMDAELPAPGNFNIWLTRNCGTYLAQKRDLQRLMTCVNNYHMNVSGRLFDASRDENSPGYYGASTLRDSFNRHMNALVDQLIFYSNNIADTSWIPTAGPAYLGGDRRLVDAMEKCMDMSLARGGFGRSSMCRLYRERYAERHARIYGYLGW